MASRSRDQKTSTLLLALEPQDSITTMTEIYPVEKTWLTPKTGKMKKNLTDREKSDLQRFERLSNLAGREQTGFYYADFKKLANCPKCNSTDIASATCKTCGFTDRVCRQCGTAWQEAYP